MTEISDALDGLNRRRLEDLRTAIDKRLQACTLCGNDGAISCRVHAKVGAGQQAFALMICRPCIEKHRLPEGRASE